jgi:hypothetical protein
MSANDDNLPVAGGFDGDDIYSDELIKGPILKFVDGRWSVKDGTVLKDGEPFLCTGTAQALQRFIDNVPCDPIRKQPGKPLPDPDELNAQIPVEEWELGFDGKPTPPWKHAYAVYVIRQHDASMMTYINSTIGARIAFNKPTSQVYNMRILRGANVAPIVKLSSKPMKTKFGEKMRPDFEIIEFRELGGGGEPTLIESPKSGSGGAAEQIGKPVAPPTSKEIFNDEIGF